MKVPHTLCLMIQLNIKNITLDVQKAFLPESCKTITCWSKSSHHNMRRRNSFALTGCSVFHRISNQESKHFLSHWHLYNSIVTCLSNSPNMQLVNLTHGFLVIDTSVMISLVLKGHALSTNAVGFFFSSTAFQLPQGVFNTILII